MAICDGNCTISGATLGRGSSAAVPCAARERLQEALVLYFQHVEFRPGQLESTLPALHGKDVFVRMATGSGKSLCMFLVPLSHSSTAMGVIISPLKALMEQQVIMSGNQCH